MARKLRQKLGEILVQERIVPEAKVAEALQTAKSSGKRIGEVLIEMGACTEEDVARALGAQFGMPFLNLERAEDSAKIDMSLIKEADAKKYLVLPMSKAGGRLKIVIHDPMDLDTLEVLRFKLGAELDTAIASRRQISYYLDGDKKGASVAQKTGSLLTDSIDKSMDKSMDKSVDKSIDVEGDDAPMVRLVNRIIIEGVTGRASDIHVEPMHDGVVVRYRIDGVCVVRDKLPKRNQAAILARFKLMAGVNMAEKRIPQDGRIKLVVEGTAIDFRVSTCPAYHGESVVLRILRPDSVRIGLVNLGLEQDTLDTFNKVIRRPNGIFLVTGPTGSGKTTTLYSALDTLNRPDRKIITAEDPVEYNFKGINQVQVREHIGLTFPIILKSMLRQAPNIILVGEIRDREVADIAIAAALTGHLVFSTLHTNDAPSAITRLIDMGVKPFLVASSIQAVLAQRLVRILCPKCRKPDPDVDPKLLRLVNISEMDCDKVMGPKGCPDCGGVGYRGRRGIYEMMTMNSEIRHLAFERSGIAKLRAAAVRNGMRGLLGDGRLKILKGMTTPDEIAKFAQIEGFDPATEMAV
ncbi:MAG: type II/IV secretion system protein [Planctomycetes bacterium]|nr:type II/IV secretion system protein [Planctomycetota bacterium]